MISRFGRSLILIVFLMVWSEWDAWLITQSSCIVQLLLTTIALIHPPARPYIDPWSGQFFGEGGVEKTLHSEDKAYHRGLKGGVIMSKLANATIKWVVDRCFHHDSTSSRAALGRATWKLLWVSAIMMTDLCWPLWRHTTTLRFPEVCHSLTTWEA
jgi:hypothetical protein